jgi:hypothetical protein
MKYGKTGSCKGPTYSTGKTTANIDNGAKVGRSAGLKMSNLSDQASGMSNKSGVSYTAKVNEKNRRGQ